VVWTSPGTWQSEADVRPRSWLLFTVDRGKVELGAKKKGRGGSEPEALEPRAAAVEGERRAEGEGGMMRWKNGSDVHTGSAISRDRSSLPIDTNVLFMTIMATKMQP
jgi:hypothetical protein